MMSMDPVYHVRAGGNDVVLSAADFSRLQAMPVIGEGSNR